MELNSKTEAIIFDSLKEFYKSEIAKAGKSLYSISLQIKKSERFIWETLHKKRSLEKLREVYYLCYPERLTKTREGRRSSNSRTEGNSV